MTRPNTQVPRQLVSILSYRDDFAPLESLYCVCSLRISSLCIEYECDCVIKCFLSSSALCSKLTHLNTHEHHTTNTR